jgi:hypothetical protein
VATRDPGLAGLLVDHRARLATLVEGIMAMSDPGQVRDRAEALVASYDGLLLAALLRPPRRAAAFLARSLELLGEQLAGDPGA